MPSSLPTGAPLVRRIEGTGPNSDRPRAREVLVPRIRTREPTTCHRPSEPHHHPCDVGVSDVTGGNHPSPAIHCTAFAAKRTLTDDCPEMPGRFFPARIGPLRSPADLAFLRCIDAVQTNSPARHIQGIAIHDPSGAPDESRPAPRHGAFGVGPFVLDVRIDHPRKPSCVVARLENRHEKAGEQKHAEGENPAQAASVLPRNA